MNTVTDSTFPEDAGPPRLSKEEGFPGTTQFPPGCPRWLRPHQHQRRGPDYRPRDPSSHQHTRLLLALAARASTSSSSSELSELLTGSDTRIFLACSAASSSAFFFRPSSEVLQDKGGEWAIAIAQQGNSAGSKIRPSPRPASSHRNICAKGQTTLICISTHFSEHFYNG